MRNVANGVTGPPNRHGAPDLDTTLNARPHRGLHQPLHQVMNSETPAARLRGQGIAGWATAALATLFLAALLMRLWGIWHADSSDEVNEVFEALRVGSGQLNYERWFKRFYLYVLAAEYGAYFALGWVLDWFASPWDFAAKIVRDPGPLFIMARVTSAVAGTLSVILTYIIGRKLWNPTTGVIAALFLCFNAVNIELSHYARVDAMLCAVVLVAFYWIVRIMQGDSARRRLTYALAGLFMGIAFQNKAPAIVLGVPFLFAHLAARDFRHPLASLLDRSVLIAAGGFVVGLVIGNPAVVFAPIKFVQGVLGFGATFTTAINETRSEHIGYVVYLQYLYRELGLPLFAFLAYSLLAAARERSREEMLILSFVIPFFGLMGASRYMVSNSYMIPMMPFIYLMCAYRLLAATRRLAPTAAASPWIASGAVVVLLAQPAINGWDMVRSFSGPNTRELAKQWIEANIPPGTKILMDSGKTINSIGPKIPESRESIERTIDDLNNKLAQGTLKDPTRIVDHNAVKYFEMLLESAPEKAYDVTSTKFGLEVKSIDYYRANGYRYFIISGEMKNSRTGSYARETYPDIARFYASLDADPQVKLVKEVGPTAVNRGDTFFIYQVN